MSGSRYRYRAVGVRADGSEVVVRGLDKAAATKVAEAFSALGVKAFWHSYVTQPEGEVQS